jgi:nitrite reductase/ring-hydroxylating ferredoxin subunit
LLIVAMTADPVVLRGLERTGAVTRSLTALTLETLTDTPAAIVADPELPGVLDAVRDWKSKWPQTLVAGFISNPSRTHWEQAEAAGFDLVASRGALAAQLQKKLKDWSPSQQRLRVCDMADLAGRLGVVARLSDLPRGPVAVYHLSGKVYAAEDVCPHAGGRLSEGALEGAVVTCPLHGSQFNVCTGERLRGPADIEIKTYRVEVEGGQVFVVLS